MKLSTALELMPKHETVMAAFVGGGGKTSSIFRLADELADNGMRVLITTTTAIYAPAASQRPGIEILGDHVTAEGKLKGIPATLADQLCLSGKYDYILVEADGSRGLPVKAPAGHEPVIPSLTSIVVGVIGADCFLSPMDEFHVHRPELFSDLTGCSNNERITEEHLIRLICSDHGLFKDCPGAGKKFLLFNKVLLPEQEMLANRIADRILEQGNDIDSILIGAVQEKEPIKLLRK